MLKVVYLGDTTAKRPTFHVVRAIRKYGVVKNPFLANVSYSDLQRLFML